MPGRIPPGWCGRGPNPTGVPGVGAGIPGIGAALTRRWMIGRPGTSTLDPLGDVGAVRACPGRAPGLGTPTGLTGRTGMEGRMPFLAGRCGLGAPGTSNGRLGRGSPAGGRGGAVVGLVGPIRGVACRICETSGGRWAVPALTAGTPSPPSGVPEPLGPADCIRGTGIEGARPPTGIAGVLGRPGTKLMSGLSASGPIAGTGDGSGFSWASTARSDARVAPSGFGLETAVPMAAGTAAARDGSGEPTGDVATRAGPGRSASVPGGFLAITGGRNGPMGGRNCPPPVTGIDGRTDADEARVILWPARVGGTLALLGRGNSSSGTGVSGASRLRARILSRTRSAVAASNELEWDLGSSMSSSRRTVKISLDLTSNSRASSLMRIVLLLFFRILGHTSPDWPGRRSGRSRFWRAIRSDLAPVLPR